MLTFRRLLLLTVVAASFPGTLRGQARPDNKAAEQAAKEQEQKARELAAVLSDKKLLSIHQEFVARAEKLALEYENGKDWDKAKTVWGEVLKLAPQHAVAQAKMKLLLEREANADATRFTVKADDAWQDTGVVVMAGKPVRVRAGGYWTFGLKLRLSPEGIQIPKELREFNLGSLIGVVDTGNPEDLKPFPIGDDKSWVPEKSGRLLLRMYDISPEDNEGSLQVEIRGSFESK